MLRVRSVSYQRKALSRKEGQKFLTIIISRLQREHKKICSIFARFSKEFEKKVEKI